MRITRTVIEGPKGTATVQRDRRAGGKEVIAVDGCGASGMLTLAADPRSDESMYYVAARLQRELDGCEGTCGDVAEYLAVIRAFAD